MIRYERLVQTAGLLSLLCVHAGCAPLIGGAYGGAVAVVGAAQPERARELSIMIQLSSREPRKPPDAQQLAHCHQIEVAIANWAGAVLYGDSPQADVVQGFVLQDTEVDKAPLGDIRDRVGEIFCDHLRESLPDKKVSYRTMGSDFCAPSFDSGADDASDSAVCLVSYTYLVHRSRRGVFVGGPIWAKHRRTVSGAVSVLELEPPLFLTRAEAFRSEAGWAREKAFWRAGLDESSLQGSPEISEYPLDCSAELDMHDLMPFRPEEVRLHDADMKAAMERWAESRARDLVVQLQAALSEEH